jgi:hypothetical protein
MFFIDVLPYPATELAAPGKKGNSGTAFGEIPE